MLDGNAIVSVTNMVDNGVSYSIPEMNVSRHFNPFETKNLTADEIRSLNFKRGGRVLLRDFLCVKNDELKKELGIPTDIPEYDYTAADIDRILLQEDDDVLRDTLDFAPEGIIELLKSRAFKLKIPDTNKRKIIFEMTGTDIDTQITLQEQAERALAQDGVEVESDKKEQPARRRRVSIK